MSYYFTSESVSSGHPDKIADLISDTVADYLLDGKSTNRAAVETLVTTDTVILAGEYKRHRKPSAKKITELVRNVIKDLGYEQNGFHWETVKVTNKLHGQSADIALGTDDFGAGDQGLMFGYACTETPEYMPLAISLSHRILQKLDCLRSNPSYEMEWLGPDAKAQVTVAYEAPNMPLRVSNVVCSTQHSDDVDIDTVRKYVRDAIELELGDWVDEQTQYLINPTGRFVIGGPDGDTGLTGRKIIVDTYGGYCPHGGGAFSGKDATKVDRTAAYMCRYLAKNIVASSLATNCTVQLSYAIGVEQPTSFYVYADGVVRDDLAKKVQAQIDLTPKGIIERFDMYSLKLADTTNYGHFGDTAMPWEKLDLVLQ